jgi:hypothetical protein
MSALEIFVRIRQYRNRATAFFQLAAGAFSPGVRERYLVIADHYNALADGEILSDRLARRRLLEQMRAMRQRKAVAAKSKAGHEAPPRVTEPVKLRIVQGAGKGAKRAGGGRPRLTVQSSFPVVKSKP